MSKKPWDIRDPSPFGDLEEDALFNAVGRALTVWEEVEAECARLFGVLVSSRQRRTHRAPAVRAFGSIVAARSRSAMLRLAAESYFATRHAKRRMQKQFEDLLREYEQYVDRRNEIAHGAVKRIFTKNTAKKPRYMGIFLIPSLYNPKKFKKGEFTYQYVSGDLVHYRQEFSKLALRIADLRKQLS